MKFINTYTVALLITFISISTYGGVGFTQAELDLVKDACLAGSSFDFKSEANGNISVKNLEGKGKLLVSKKNVTTVDLPDSDKREEFQEIRSCIKGYLIDNKKDDKKSGLQSGAIVAQCGCWGFVNFGQIGNSQVCASGREQAYPCPAPCPAGGAAWGTRCL